MTKERKIMPMPEGDRLTMGEYEPHHPAGQEPLPPLDEAVLLLRRLCRHDLADAVAATCKPSSIAASAGEFDPTFGGASTRENLNKYDALEQFASSVRMEGEDTMSEANELVRLRDDNAMLNTLRVQLSTDSQAHLDRALAAEAELEAARENEGNAWEMVHLLRADNAALRTQMERIASNVDRFAAPVLAQKLVAAEADNAALREQVAAVEQERDNLRRDRDFWKESASQWSAQSEFGNRKP